ncbi:MAG: alpha/beta hydrolase [Planctomycetia bacterium]|nr:alpha/beta hydrolase [Planctomycetia bacterium]
MMLRSLLVLLVVVSSLRAQVPEATVKEDIVYGRKYGVALTMDVFTPNANRNGAGVIMVVSGGFFSSKEAINRAFFNVMLARGYVVFAVVHGSQPKFTIPEIVDDMNRAVRFIRYHAKDYGVDPDRLGIMGASAGGHLSLMMGCASREGNPSAKDPVDRVSSRIAAVGCFFPPTDFLNYGKEGEVALGTGILQGFWPAFDFQTLDGKKGFVPVDDMEKRKEVGKQISPLYHVTSDDAPTLIIHGDADKLVPIQQAELIIAKLKENNVVCELVVKPGKAHGWAGIDKDLVIISDWFDKHVAKKGQ